MDISKVKDSESVNFYSPYWRFAKCTKMGTLRRFVQIWGGYIIRDSDYGSIHTVIVNGVEIGYFYGWEY